MTLLGGTILGCVIGYLVGGVPVGLIVGRINGVDILTLGSGNIGAANVGRHLGLRWGLTVFAFDVLKGLVPAILAGQWLLRPPISPDPANPWALLCWMIVGLSAVLGHNHSPYLGFRGGKGVATSLGVALGIYPHLTVPALLGVATWATLVALTRISSAGSIAAAIAFPASYTLLSLYQGWDTSPRWPFLAFTLCACMLVLVRHRANIARLLNGTEARLGRRTIGANHPDAQD